MTDALRAFVKNNALELALPESDEELRKHFEILMFQLLKRPLWDEKSSEWDSEWGWLRLDLRDIRTALNRKKRGSEKEAVDLSQIVKDRLDTFLGPAAKTAMALKGRSISELYAHFKKMKIDTALALMDIIEDVYMEFTAPNDVPHKID